ncbi:MAG: cysteine synthase family protein [Alphaproteobacteria bacterium]|nr:cysteine synthase family protein [Alphaproteobacteria bacterium]
MHKFFNSLTDMIGSTPMLKINNLKKRLSLKADVYAKCEFYNPLFSIKDRAGLRIIENAVSQNKIDQDTIFVEATSGNIGVAIAGICASKNLKALLVMPENTSKEKIKMIKHLGADVILTPKEDGMDGAIAKAEMLAQKSDKVILLRQFTNQGCIDAHLFGTATEIMNDLGGNIDVIIASVGTSGTLTGVAQALKSSNPDLYVVAVEPLSSNVLNGGKKGTHKIHGIGAGFIPPLYKKDLVDEVYDVSDDDAWDMAKVIAQTEGLPIGISSGAAFVATVDVASREELKNKNIVVILPDAMTNYLSEL